MARLSPDPNAEYVTYFILSACGRYMKIGTTCNLEKRMMELRGEGQYYDWKEDLTDENMHVVGYLPGSIDVERGVQNRFHHLQYTYTETHSHRSEWFRATGELVEYVLTQTVPFTGYESVRGVTVPAGTKPSELAARAIVIDWQPIPRPAPAPTADEAAA